MSKAFRVIGALKFIWHTRDAPLITKVKLQNTILLNLSLQGSENWSGNRNNLTKCKAFHYKSMHKVLEIIMLEVKDQKN